MTVGWRARARAAAGWIVANPDPWVALAVALASVVLLAVTADQGFVRDEGYYFRAASDYHRWFEDLWRNLWAGQLGLSFSDAALRKAFGYNTEHPGLIKIAMGWTHKLFHDWLGWTSRATGYRLASIALVAVGNGFTYLLGVRLFSRPVALLGVALLLVSPHVFYHAHLACFDGPIMGLTVVVAYAFWRSLESRAWIIGAGLAWGVAVASKHNALFLLPTLGLAWAGARAAQFRITRRAELELPALPVSFIAMLLIGPLVFYVFYPYGWHDPIVRVTEYLRFHLHHEHYPVDYFGTLYTAPPFPLHFPFVMSALTIPLPILIPGCLGTLVIATRLVKGMWHSWRGVEIEDPWPRWLLLTNLLLPPVLIALPTVPIFGGTKHWMTMMPFLCLVAAWVIWGAAGYLRARLNRVGLVAAGALVVAVLVMPAVETARTHPLGHTYFNELAGGHQGGAALGMPRTFWGGDGRGLLETLNAEAGRGAKVFTDRMNQDDFQAYKRDGLLRSDLRWVLDLRRADWVVINHQREYQENEYQVWSLAGHRRPVVVVDVDGVPIASLYQLAQE